MKRLISLFMLLNLLAFVSCGGGGRRRHYVSDAYNGWHDRYGHVCGNLAPGCNFHKNGDKIILEEDPFATNGKPGIFWEYSYSITYREWTWESPSGIIYDDHGNALNRGHEISNGRDIITNVAEAEKIALQKAAQYYARKFGLVQNQGMRLARTLNDFAILQNRTAQDINDFTKRLYGVNLSNVVQAVELAKEGQQGAFDTLLETAASHFRITPESMKGMVKSLHKELLDEAGIDLD